MEIKKPKLKNPSMEQMSSLAKDALNQIHEIDDIHSLTGKTLQYCIVFHRKDLTIVRKAHTGLPVTESGTEGPRGVK